ncbi:MAG TPA: hypothetical protein VHR97_12865 [Candidatus Baltobacteraceae bacterium]|jgi:hypothetical protein|nr:hypothetical protein [Candidatus Baltobacteraceae bacterium]
MSTTNCRTLDDPRYSGQDELLAINRRGVVLGYDNGSYLAWPPYGPKDYRYLGEYPGAQRTVITGFAGKRVMVGYVTNPNQLKGTWGFIRTNGLWSILSSRKGKGQDSVTELLGVNRHGVAAGFYLNRHGVAVPFA